jgi:predicted ATPase
MELSFLLSHLEINELIQRDDSPDLSYLFKHALTQESAYESLLKSKRRASSQRCRDHRATCSRPARANARIGVPLRPSQNGRQGIHLRRACGDYARRAYANDEARVFYDRALEIAQRSPDPQWTQRIRNIYANRGNVLEHSRIIRQRSKTIRT